MANSAPTGFVGVPKREPCRKCGNPVFFAERISFEQKLYHRSCLKCARCNAQLTLGSFYETETDGEYCCETCPDEEIQLSQRRRSSAGGSDSPASVTNGSRDGVGGVRVNRSSSKLLDRISFFESAPLSDEEKTSNLVRRAKISSFLKDTLDSSEDGLENGHATEVKETSKLAVPIESEDESSSDEEPPDPPTTAPPELIVSKEPQLTENDTKEEEAPKALDTKEEEAPKEIEETPKAEPVAIVREESVQDIPEITVRPISETEESHKDLEPNRRNSSTSDKVEVDEVTSQEEKDVVKAVNDEVVESIEEQRQVEEAIPVEVSEETVPEKSVEEVPKAVEKLEEQPEISIKEEVPKHDNEVRSDEPVAVPMTVVTVPDGKPEDDASTKAKELYPTDLNPFGDESDGEQQEASIKTTKPIPSTRRVSTNPFGSDDEEETSLPVAVKPPRPPPPKLKTAVPANPFDDEDDEPEREIVPVIVKPSPRRTPVPTPRKQHNHNDSISSMETSLMSSQFGGSSLSLASSMESGPSNATISRRKKSRAPDIPTAAAPLKASTENLAGSTLTTPRKKRLAPAPPTVSSTPKQSDSKASSPKSTQRLITLDASLINNYEDDIPQTDHPAKPPASDDSVVYRRTIVPLKVDDDSLTLDSSTTSPTSERQWEKMKDNKEAQNRNRQSQTSPTSSQNNDSYNSFISNKSQQGKWKRRKGPAPALPVPLPERKAIKMLPLKEIRQEMDIIETQQQGLEKQGVILEQMIRERCEGVGPEMDITGIQTNSKEVEDLIMQLFELVNEKNELFRRQAELMYLRRQHRLEQEQADLEYEIRLLMAQPERNKTDSDKEKEEALIARLVEIVQMRNEVVDCLEMDRLREAEEDMSIKQSIEERAANQQKHGKKDSDTEKSATGDLTMKLSKKEKKKLKEAKKLVKSKKIDSEKDADDTESSSKEKKKKKKFFADFLHHK